MKKLIILPFLLSSLFIFSTSCGSDEPNSEPEKPVVSPDDPGKDPDEPAVEPAKLAEVPVNPNATKEAKALYAYLHDNYGDKMLSGAMGGVAWETSYTDYINSRTGKYPAVVGFDYIHLCYSPANWINYGDITPVKNVWDNGGIVQIGWHWNVPTSEGSSTMSFYSQSNRFNPANILVEGTWENRVAKADLEELAGYLSLLQDAGIPVIWRPFHEAAGDYTWGPWFWWGTKGTQVTKSLYIWLYNQLTNTYHINNLLWAWTMQTSDAGNTASIDKIRYAYPGDDYVDIVGPDIYPNQPLTDQTEQFNLVNSVVEGRKMIALTECGNLIDPTKAKNNNALWLYFMQWYDMNDKGEMGHYNYQGAQWNTVLASPLVTVRGGIPSLK